MLATLLDCCGSIVMSDECWDTTMYSLEVAGMLSIHKEQHQEMLCNTS